MAGRKFTHVAHTLYHWGAGNSEEEARKQLDREAGATWVREYGIRVLEFSAPTSIRVDEVDGTTYLDQGITHTVVRERKGPRLPSQNRDA
jgi:hypothetical protein